MKRLILLLVLSSNLNAQFLWQIYPDKIIKWNYYDGDEFNKQKVDKDKWLTSLPWSHAVLSQDIYYLESNISFSQGRVQFILKKEDNWFPLQNWEMDTVLFKRRKIKLQEGNKFPFKYTGGLLYTKRDYKYGYFEIKFRAPEGQGIWPAFWLYGAKPNNEIDFFELKGEKESELHLDIHCPKGCANYKEGPFGYRRGWGQWVKTTQKLKEGYNVMAGEWTPNYIKWFLNGELIGYSNHAFDLGMGLTAGTGIAKNGEAFKPGPNKKTPFPNYFNVDYIRVYKSDTLPNYKEIKNNLALTNDSAFDKTQINFKARKNKSNLKNNPDKKVKQQNVITFSIIQITANSLSVRVLGTSKGDSIVIKINNSKGELIKELSALENIEIAIPFNEKKELKVHAEINKQIIDETIIIQ
jgi:beta-glucanase (GH16 family)